MSILIFIAISYCCCFSGHYHHIYSFLAKQWDFNVWRYINEGETSLINNDGQRVLTFNGYTTVLAMLTGSRLLIW
ncbi:hypothetical protein WN944_007682 [Citrus x changshan-huyou]|uniref:Uncharacterized protein n=1 Tax=Citrus x changshan-huyou TaxID=2935761 RepID=A0AAP0MRA3_9ROSI